MATITFKGTSFETVGDLPPKGEKAPDFHLLRTNLSEATLASFKGSRKILNVFPSIDTNVCAQSVKRFNQEITQYPGVAVLNISKDLPFAHKRFCGTENIANAEALSGLRSTFGKDYGVEILDGPLMGLYARAVIVLDQNDRVIHRELVSEIASEPDYLAALKVIREG